MNNPTPVQIDPGEIARHMVAERDRLLAEAEDHDANARQARQQASEAAEQVLREGQALAERHERRAAERRAYAEHWNAVIAREEQAAGLPSGSYAVPAESEASA